jgi:glycosyltransferase involved in cell wall biosynthesis
MKICVVTGIFPPDIGGPASYVALLAESLHSLRREVEVITYSSARARSTHPFPVHRISRSLPLPLRLLATLVKILHAAHRSKLIYCNGLIVPSAIASLLLRKPMVMKVEGDLAWERATNVGRTEDSIEAFQTRPQDWRTALLKVIRNWCLKRSETVITTSRFLAKLIRGWGYRGCVEVIGNAVEESFGAEYAEIPREQCKQRIGFSGKTIVLSVGRFVSWKGFRAVILTARSLDPGVVVLIIGEGPDGPGLKRLIESNDLEDRVFLLGKISRRKLAVYLKAADCFVLNSGYESFSHVTLEAMKMGTPVVAARAAGVPELVEHGKNGFLFEKDDMSRMVACMKTCLDDRASRERVTAEAARRLSDYSWQRIFPRTVKVLQDTARRHR